MPGIIGLRHNFKRGSQDFGDSRRAGPAGGASAGGNYGGNRNPEQTYGGGGDGNSATRNRIQQEQQAQFEIDQARKAQVDTGDIQRRGGLDVFRDILNPRNIFTYATGVPFNLIDKLNFTGAPAYTPPPPGGGNEGIASLPYVNPYIYPMAQEEIIEEPEEISFYDILRQNLGLV
jgi:hypothetical protein